MLCNTVIVKFAEINTPRQEISATSVSGAKYLWVEREADFITVQFKLEGGDVIKEINFRSDNVKEYSLEGVFTIPVVLVKLTPHTLSGNPITLDGQQCSANQRAAK